MLSHKARYALRALVELARENGGQMTAADLSARADAPRKFLEAILLELSRRGIVRSRRASSAATPSPGPRRRSPSPRLSARSTARWPWRPASAAPRSANATTVRPWRTAR